MEHFKVCNVGVDMRTDICLVVLFVIRKQHL